MSSHRSIHTFLRSTSPWRAVVIGAALMMSGVAMAQDARLDVEALLDRRMATYRDRLDLTTAQETHVRDIQSEHLRKMADTLRDAGEKTRPRARLRALREARALRAETTARMGEVLSTDQLKTYEDLLTAQEEALRARLAARQASEK